MDYRGYDLPDTPLREHHGKGSPDPYAGHSEHTAVEGDVAELTSNKPRYNQPQKNGRKHKEERAASHCCSSVLVAAACLGTIWFLP